MCLLKHFITHLLTGSVCLWMQCIWEMNNIICMMQLPSPHVLTQPLLHHHPAHTPTPKLQWNLTTKNIIGTTGCIQNKLFLFLFSVGCDYHYSAHDGSLLWLWLRLCRSVYARYILGEMCVVYMYISFGKTALPSEVCNTETPVCFTE